MANTKSSTSFHEYATVDNDPGGSSGSNSSTDGYFTNSINPRQLREKGAKDIYFSVRDYGVAANMIITIQFRCEGDTDWTDYNETNIVQRKVLEDNGVNALWRAGVKDTDFESGKMSFGFDW